MLQSVPLATETVILTSLCSSAVDDANICAQETQVTTPRLTATTATTSLISSSPALTEKDNVGPKSIKITLKLEDSPPLPFVAAPNPKGPSPVVSESKTKVLVGSAGVDYTSVISEPTQDTPSVPVPTAATGLIRRVLLSICAEKVVAFTGFLDGRLLVSLSTILALAFTLFILWSLRMIPFTVIVVRKPVKDPPAPVVRNAVEDPRASECRRRFSEPNITYSLAVFQAQLRLEARNTVAEHAQLAPASQHTTVEPHAEAQVTTLASPTSAPTNNDSTTDSIPAPEPVGADVHVEASTITPSSSSATSTNMEGTVTESTAFKSSSPPGTNSGSDHQVSSEFSCFSSPPLSHLPPGRIPTPRADFYTSPSQSFEAYYAAQASEGEQRQLSSGNTRHGRKRQKLKRRHTTGRTTRQSTRTGYVRAPCGLVQNRVYDLDDDADEEDLGDGEAGPSTLFMSNCSSPAQPSAAGSQEEHHNHGLGDGEAGPLTLLASSCLSPAQSSATASEDKDLEPEDNESAQRVGLGITCGPGEEQNRSRFAWVRNIFSRKRSSEGRSAAFGQGVLDARQGYT
ncbi:hypothetical protein C0995_010204 [Termitomyces sp. Mi166|nr:hypothetical protein C0995_010204 [Termitomyces sp. Mi166\